MNEQDLFTEFEFIYSHHICDYIDPPSLNLLPTKFCSNCLVVYTKCWRRSNNGSRLCNACGLYEQSKGIARPFLLFNNYQQKQKRKRNKKKSVVHEVVLVHPEYKIIQVVE